MNDWMNDLVGHKRGGHEPTLAGTADIFLASQLLGIEYENLRKHSRYEDFPKPVHVLSGIKIYDISKIARYMGVSTNPVRNKENKKC